MSLINTANKVGPRTEPCGIPLPTVVHGDDSPSITTLCFLLDKKALIHARTSPPILREFNFKRRRTRGTESNAFAKSV